MNAYVPCPWICSHISSCSHILQVSLGLLSSLHMLLLVVARQGIQEWWGVSYCIASGSTVTLYYPTWHDMSSWHNLGIAWFNKCKETSPERLKGGSAMPHHLPLLLLWVTTQRSGGWKSWGLMKDKGHVGSLLWKRQMKNVRSKDKSQGLPWLS